MNYKLSLIPNIGKNYFLVQIISDREREHQPRFVSPNSFEYVWAKRWRDLFIEEQDKKAKLEQEMADARVKLEFEMEAAIRQQDASRIREGR